MQSFIQNVDPRRHHQEKKGIRRVNCVLAPSTSRERDNVVCEREGRDGTARAISDMSPFIFQ